MYSVTSSIHFGGFKEVNNIPKEQKEDLFIINVSKTDHDDSNIWIPLKDGVYDNGGNDQQTFAKAVNAVRDQIQTGNNIFVHCAIGQSRSVSVLSTAISAETDQQFDDVKNELMDIRGSFSEPANSLQKKAKKYLRHTR